MVSTPNKGYSLQTAGSNTGTWGLVANGIFSTIDSNLGGTLAISVAGNSNVTLTALQAQNLFHSLSGVLTGSISYILPQAGGFYYINNGTTGSYTVTVTATGCTGGVVVPQGSSRLVYVDATSLTITQPQTDGGVSHVMEHRLTTVSGVPVTTTDQVGVTTLYMTPYKGNLISLYNSNNWVNVSTGEISIALGTLTAGINYDVFAFLNASSVSLQLAPWTSGTLRATALVYQDGVLVKSGAPLLRYIGTFYTTSTTTTESSAAKRNVWNMYNRVHMDWQREDTGTGASTYTTAAFRQANANAANQLECVVGMAEESTEINTYALVSNTLLGVSVSSGIGIDSTTVNSAQSCGGQTQAAAGVISTSAKWSGVIPLGHHVFPWLEYSTATGTTTWWYFSGQYFSGICGRFFG